MTADPAAPRGDRTWLSIVVGFVVLWGLYLAFFGPGRLGPGRNLEGSGLAQPADYGWKLRDLNGGEVSFSRFKGKPIFLNIWATWCGPCVRELPSIAQLAERKELEGVQVVCVATDDSAETVKSFVARQNWPSSMIVLHASDLPPVFFTEGIPATFIIDPSGRVVASEVGSADWNTPEVVSLLKKLKVG
ncbi:MAG: TlpA disulfide reductase family protein [Isosphaeraceae bacterium]